jgi:DivIVA domain-containing protein
MSAYQRDTDAGRRNPEAPPDFQVVRRGYDREQVDAYIPQLVARLDEAVDRYAKAERARAELEREVASLRENAQPTFEQLGAEAATVLGEAGRSAGQLVETARRRADLIVEEARKQAERVRADVAAEAQAILAQAREVAEHIRQEVEQERAALYAETDQVREFRDGLLDHLGRVHGDISALLERTRKHRDETMGVVDGAARRLAEPAPGPAEAGKDAEPPKPGEAAKPEEPTKLDEPPKPSEPAKVSEPK